MNDKEKNIIYTARDIEQYLSGDLSPMQMHTMEKAALDDPFLAEAMEGYEGMKDKDWSKQLAALREEISGRGSVAKVIPLHKSKNNWWKAVAAILILGCGIVLTFTLTKNNREEKNTPAVAQTINVAADSTVPTENTAPPPSVTASLNPNASSTKEDLKTPNGPLAEGKKDVNNYNVGSGATQISPAAPVTAIVVADDKVSAIPPPAGNANTVPAGVPGQPVTFNGTEQRADEVTVLKSSQASKQNNNAEVLMSNQKTEAFAKAKKEAVLNNYFTAQVVGTDNTPLPFTNISIKKENFGTYADAKGMVRLVSTDSILNIEVKSVGYLPKTFALRNNQAQTKIVLQEDQVAYRDKMVIGDVKAVTSQRSRRATVVTDSMVNVEPADGWENYNTYVANNLDIPEDMLKREVHGEVELSFEVRSNGTISNIRINKSLGAEYDEAAKRLILEGPQWKVKKGKKTSASVKVQF